MNNSNNINNFRKTRAGIISVTRDHGHGGTVDLNPDITSIVGQFPPYTMPQQGTLNPQTGKYEFTVTVGSTTPKFKILTTFRQ